MKTLASISLVTFLFAFSSSAADQLIGLEHKTPDRLTVDSPAAEATAFWERYQVRFDRRANDVFTDVLSPMNFVNWNLEPSSGNVRDFRGLPARDAEKAVRRATLYSFRDAFFELPSMVWLKDRQDFFAQVIRNSVGNVGEEDVSPHGVSYRAVERSWWDNLADRSGLSYGLRPFRSNPYAFLSWNWREDGKTILLGHMRYHLRNFTEHCFEMNIAVPITQRLSLGLGSSYKCGGDIEDKGIGLTLYRTFKNGGYFHLGADLHRRPSLIAGLTLPW